MKRGRRVSIILPVIEMLCELQQYESLLHAVGCNIHELVEVVVKNWIKQNTVEQNGKLADFYRQETVEDIARDLIEATIRYRASSGLVSPMTDSKDIEDGILAAMEVCQSANAQLATILYRLKMSGTNIEAMEIKRWLGDDIVVETIGHF